MRWTRPAAGACLIAIGGIWAFQGYGTLKGSFMTGSPTWLWIGIACVVVGAALLLTWARARR